MSILQAEVRRVLQPLRGSSASSAADLQGVFAFLSNAVYSSKLRGVMMEEVGLGDWWLV